MQTRAHKRASNANTRCTHYANGVHSNAPPVFILLSLSLSLSRLHQVGGVFPVCAHRCAWFCLCAGAGARVYLCACKCAALRALYSVVRINRNMHNKRHNSTLDRTAYFREMCTHMRLNGTTRIGVYTWSGCVFIAQLCYLALLVAY